MDRGMKWRLLSIKRAVSVDRMPQSRRSILSKYFPSLKETAIIDDLIVNENLKLTTIKYIATGCLSQGQRTCIKKSRFCISKIWNSILKIYGSRYGSSVDYVQNISEVTYKPVCFGETFCAADSVGHATGSGTGVSAHVDVE